jgi:hypothetical protein
MPTSCKTAVLVGPMLGRVVLFCPDLKLPNAMMLPLPFGLSRHHFSDEMPKTLPSGATHWCGYHQRLWSGPKASRLLAPKRLLQPEPGVKTSGVIETP